MVHKRTGTGSPMLMLRTTVSAEGGEYKPDQTRNLRETEEATTSAGLLWHLPSDVNHVSYYCHLLATYSSAVDDVPSSVNRKKTER